ncbi:MAG TPA: hypothetical protein VFH70_08735, partial [Acidimicrobiales bacterium]|nr:hypothetical protein [Acidimicrobiales bacterium]
RDRARIAAGDTDPDMYRDWMEQERPFQAAERPWERAAVIVAGTTSIPHDPAREAVVGELD